MKTPGLAATAKNLFDPNNTVLLDKDWIVERCVFAYRDRRNVARSLDDLESISKALGSFLYAIAGVIMFLVGTVVFSEGDLANTTVSLGTTVFAFSFAFAATAQQFFTAFVFLFIRYLSISRAAMSSHSTETLMTLGTACSSLGSMIDRCT